MIASYSVTIDLELNDFYYFLTELRSSYGLDTPAHVTIILSVPSSDLSVLRKRLASVAGRISPFDLNFGDEIKLLPPSSSYPRPCVLVPVEGLYLQDIWGEVYPQCASGWQRLIGTYKPYEPHVTIAYPSEYPREVHGLVKADYLTYKSNHRGKLGGRALGLQLWSRAADGGIMRLEETFKFPGLFKSTINVSRHFSYKIIQAMYFIAMSFIYFTVLVLLVT